jgi:hypothetical protein
MVWICVCVACEFSSKLPVSSHKFWVETLGISLPKLQLEMFLIGASWNMLPKLELKQFRSSHNPLLFFAYCGRIAHPFAKKIHFRDREDDIFPTRYVSTRSVTIFCSSIWQNRESKAYQTRNWWRVNSQFRSLVDVPMRERRILMEILRQHRAPISKLPGIFK